MHRMPPTVQSCRKLSVVLGTRSTKSLQTMRPLGLPSTNISKKTVSCSLPSAILRSFSALRWALFTASRLASRISSARFWASCCADVNTASASFPSSSSDLPPDAPPAAPLAFLVAAFCFLRFLFAARFAVFAWGRRTRQQGSSGIATECTYHIPCISYMHHILTNYSTVPHLLLHLPLLPLLLELFFGQGVLKIAEGISQ
eukprot:SAG11_NODE_8_length_31217_cov_52.169677_23_plen_201_part_00